MDTKEEKQKKVNEKDLNALEETLHSVEKEVLQQVAIELGKETTSVPVLLTTISTIQQQAVQENHSEQDFAKSLEKVLRRKSIIGHGLASHKKHSKKKSAQEGVAVTTDDVDLHKRNAPYRHRRSLSSPGVAEHLARKKFEEYQEAKAEEFALGPSSIVDPLMSGNLFFKKNHKWKKRWVVLDQEYLYIFKRFDDIQQPISVNLFCASLRLREDKKLHFTILTAATNFEFSAEVEAFFNEWVTAIQDVCANLIHKTIGTYDNKMKSRSNSISDRKQPSSSTVLRQEVRELLQIPGNNICADCGKEDPEWVSTNLGVFVCIECSGIHRNLGTHISKVRSIQYDKFESQHLELLQSLGNKKANDQWEYLVTPGIKPTKDSPIQEKSNWIKAKYVDLAFVVEKFKAEILSKRQLEMAQMDEAKKLESIGSPVDKKSKKHKRTNRSVDLDATSRSLFKSPSTSNS